MLAESRSIICAVARGLRCVASVAQGGGKVKPIRTIFVGGLRPSWNSKLPAGRRTVRFVKEGDRNEQANTMDRYFNIGSLGA
jgi:hypothetical protein